MAFYINGLDKSSSREIAYYLRKCILHHRRPWTELVFLCIGTDRIAGDALGPYIGYQLSKYQIPRACVYGTLRDPVHALNLETVASQIQDEHFCPLVVAIDASLGTKKHLGCVTIENGPLYPGAGVQKNLSPVGDISITGIVNISGLFEQFILQTTRLSTVIAMADSITEGILRVIPQYYALSERNLSI
ncbi:MAG: spore protease YyaC [Eubacteriales bacterium]|nr:spore protease YyaC [Eubacteriales bacterium]